MSDGQRYGIVITYTMVPQHFRISSMSKLSRFFPRLNRRQSLGATKEDPGPVPEGLEAARPIASTGEYSKIKSDQEHCIMSPGKPINVPIQRENCSPEDPINRPILNSEDRRGSYKSETSSSCLGNEAKSVGEIPLYYKKGRRSEFKQIRNCSHAVASNHWNAALLIMVRCISSRIYFSHINMLLFAIY